MNPPPLPSETRYEQALRRLLGLADYERVAGIGSPLVKADLGRMRELADRIGNPQASVPVIHIAGTKGKGSTAAMVSSILTAAGHRAGLFTSPHLHTFRERVRVNGEPLSEERFAHAIDRIWPHIQAMTEGSEHGSPTTFELLTAMAFDLPASEGVDVLVLEVGLGGRLDSTNVADATVDVITSISLDHMAILGDTIELIAAEKAGIVKSPVPVVVEPQSPAAMAVIERRIAEQGARAAIVGRDVRYEVIERSIEGQRARVTTALRTYDLRIPLLGDHQAINAAAAIAAVEAFDPAVGRETVERGIATARWDGRFQVLGSGPPTVVVDGAHNPHSMGVLRETVARYLPDRRVAVVFGCSSDKELTGMVREVVAMATHVIACTSRHPRAVPLDRLVQAFAAQGVTATPARSVADAIDAAKGLDADAIVITGSLFVVGEALEAWQGIEPERYPELERKEPVSGRG